jgi:lipopolysaccharide/colanic/teichoic acid biosynthesis glycosyltransferase
LSVRPGVTGLWQVRRTRRRGCDFQEWIKFDLDYVDRSGWGTDLKIIFATLGVVLRGSSAPAARQSSPPVATPPVPAPAVAPRGSL